MSFGPRVVRQICNVNLSRGTVFLGAAVLACGAWLAFYATSPFHRAADQVIHKAVQLTPQVLQRYAGNYELGGEIFTLTVRAGRLFVATPDHAEIPERELLAASATQFFLRDTQGDLVATQDGHGRISGFLFTQGNRSRDVRKIR
jgi:hypothetical protein